MIGLIGGSNLHLIDALVSPKKSVIRTPFGIPSAPLISGTLNGREVVFLARHGLQHTIPPHIINYRANIWALHHLGCQEVLAFSSMCSIDENMQVGQFVVPDQLIDYTWNRASTFFDSHLESVQYTEFSQPYSATSRAKLIDALQAIGSDYHDQATYGITQGPRYETRAEVQRYRNDGCHLLGMTGMPEAALAQEVNMCFAVCGLITKKVSSTQMLERIDSDSAATELLTHCLMALN